MKVGDKVRYKEGFLTNRWPQHKLDNVNEFIIVDLPDTYSEEEYNVYYTEIGKDARW